MIGVSATCERLKTRPAPPVALVTARAEAEAEAEAGTEADHTANPLWVSDITAESLNLLATLIFVLLLKPEFELEREIKGAEDLTTDTATLAVLLRPILSYTVTIKMVVLFNIDVFAAEKVIAGEVKAAEE
jgi:CheY-like chemotaxis protein